MGGPTYVPKILSSWEPHKCNSTKGRAKERNGGGEQKFWGETQEKRERLELSIWRGWSSYVIKGGFSAVSYPPRIYTFRASKRYITTKSHQPYANLLSDFPLWAIPKKTYKLVGELGPTNPRIVGNFPHINQCQRLYDTSSNCPLLVIVHIAKPTLVGTMTFHMLFQRKEGHPLEFKTLRKV